MMRVFLLLLWVSSVLGQGLIAALKRQDSLGLLYTYVTQSANLTNIFNTANNFTFLAPSDDAIKQWLAAKGSVIPSTDEIEATITYHLLQGGWPTVSFSTTPQFVSTSLRDSRFTNVTTGQAVELVLARSGPQFISGDQDISTLKLGDVVATGGIIHIVNSVLTIPRNIVTLITQSNLNFFVGILNQGGYLNAASSNLVQPALGSPNQLIFAPNTAAALAAFTNIRKNASQAELGSIFGYHVVPNILGYSANLRDGLVLKTQEGTNLHITIRGNNTFVNSARIIASDFLTSNGVLHTLDSLLDRRNTIGPPASKSGLTGGAKAGLAIGIILALVLTAGLAYFYFIWLRRRKEARRDPPMDISNPITIQKYQVQEPEETRRKPRNGSFELDAPVVSAVSHRGVEDHSFAVELDATERVGPRTSYPRQFV